MATDRFSEEQNLVPASELYEHAALAVMRDSVAGVPGLTGLLAGRVRKEPIPIFDINGTLLFFDYAVGRGAETAGYVRTAASRVVGPPVVAIEIGPRHWDYAAAVRRLKPRVKKQFPGAAISEPKLVCYSYPKLGVMFHAKSAEKSTRAIFDVADLSPIPESPRPDREGSYAWSFYDALSDQERRARSRRFAQADDARKALSSRVRAAISSARSLQAVVSRIDWRFRSTVTKLLAVLPPLSVHARTRTPLLQPARPTGKRLLRRGHVPDDPLLLPLLLRADRHRPGMWLYPGQRLPARSESRL